MSIFNIPATLSGKPKPKRNGIPTGISQLETQIAKTRVEVQAIALANDKTEQTTLKVLENILAIYEYASMHIEAEDFLSAEYKKAGIRVTKTTPSPVTPLMKLVAREFPKETQSRSVAAINFAIENRIGPKMFAEFIIAKGGIVKCAIAHRKGIRPKKLQKLATKNDEHLE